MSRQHELYLDDIKNSIEKIEEYREEFSEQELGEENVLTDAVIRNLEVIGEAVKNLPEEVKQEEPVVPWREIAGFRDVLIHQYFQVNPDIIKDIVQKKLPELKQVVRRISDTN
jgi:uncharacterized protein with HEPN domain